MVLNDDDSLMHDAVETMRTLFARHPNIALIGGHAIHFTADQPPIGPRTISAQLRSRPLELDIRQPADSFAYERYNDLNMTHSASCFRRDAWKAVGGYYSDARRRIVPFSDRDFQLRVNALFPVGVSPTVAFSFWRTYSSVDAGRNS